MHSNTEHFYLNYIHSPPPHTHTVLGSLRPLHIVYHALPLSYTPD